MPVLVKKLNQLQRRGLMDAGLVFVQLGMLQEYLSEGEVEVGLTELGAWKLENAIVRLLGTSEEEDEFVMSQFVDKTPMTICAKAPIEFAVEMFGKLGLRHLCITEEGSGKACGCHH